MKFDRIPLMKMRSLIHKTNKCPYCGIGLEKFPTKKTKCKSCGKYYYVKRAPSENKKRIVTEKEAIEIDKQWEEKSFLNQFSCLCLIQILSSHS